MRYFWGTPLLMVVLAACAPIELNDGEQYFDRITPDPAALRRAEEENRLKQAENLPVTVRSPETTAPQSGDSVTVDAVKAVPKDTATVDVIKAEPNDAAPVDVAKAAPKKSKSTTEGDGTISDSQDFKAVTARETIASDAAKLEELKSNYEIVQPGAVPRRGAGINLAKYALTQNNPVGQKLYKRNPLGGLRSKKKCANFISPDEAQLVFLKSGGPKKDRRGLDPDGDGYACNWTPDIYRAMIGQ